MLGKLKHYYIKHVGLWDIFVIVWSTMPLPKLRLSSLNQETKQQKQQHTSNNNKGQPRETQEKESLESAMNIY